MLASFVGFPRLNKFIPLSTSELPGWQTHAYPDLAILGPAHPPMFPSSRQKAGVRD